MKQDIYERHTRLKAFPPAQLIYIIYRRLVEHGVRVTLLWIWDKIARRARGVSPPEISQIQPLLHLGAQHAPRGLAEMRARGISAVVNMREESDDRERGVLLDHYLWLPTTDDDPPTLDVLREGAAFIAEQVKAGRGVYVHCAAGVGRAPAMVAAYLVSTGMSAQQAWDTIIAIRPFIRPTTPQLEIIERFAETMA